MNRNCRGNLLRCGLILALGGTVAGCSVAMEATRPAPVRLNQFNHGESREAVVSKLGPPVTTTTDADGASCDLYPLHLSGYGAGGKAAIAFGEVVADVFTLGIAEAVSTPTEAITRNKKTPVWFCYKNDALARVTPKKLEGEDLASSDASLGPIPAHGTATSSSVGTPPASSPAAGVLPSVPPATSAPISTNSSSATE